MVINHDAIVGNYCLIYSNTVIRPNVILEEKVRIGNNCVITVGAKITQKVIFQME